MQKTIIIQGKEIGEGKPVFVVAEISGNHHQKYEEAEALVRAAHKARADAIKLQTYTPDTITMKSDKKWFRVGENDNDNPEIWKGKTLYELYQTAYTPWDWQPKLKKLADELGIILFSTPFDVTAVDFLEAMNVPCYKIASYEATDEILLKKVAQTKKPVIISVGYASGEEVERAVAILREHGSGEIVVLHCITDYKSEADENNANLATITDIAERFNVVAGFSDNSGGIDVPLIAAKSGAAIIEKHIILDRALGGPDAQFSLEPEELKEMVAILRGKKEHIIDGERYQRAFGEPHYGPRNEIEKYNLRWRRSLFVTKDIKKGERFTPENIHSIRPAFGLHTRHYEEVLGEIASRNIEAGTSLSWDLICVGAVGKNGKSR